MTTQDLTILTAMHTGVVAGRRTTQEVAGNIVGLGLDANLPTLERLELQRLAEHHALYRRGYSMPTSYRRHPGLARAYAAADAAMTLVLTSLTGHRAADLAAAPATDPTDPGALRTWVTWANDVLGLDGDADANPTKRGPRTRVKTYDYGDGYSYSYRAGSRGRRGDSHGHADPRTKLDATERRQALPGVSVRAYRRAAAAVNHLEQRTVVLAAERDREAAVAFGKSRLGSTITLEDFVADPATAAFVAYYMARLGQRTVFTNGSQERPMDTVAEALLNVAMAGPGFRADVAAKVLTRRSILTLLTEQQKGELLGTYYEQLAACSRALANSFDPKRDRTRMVARPGDDSSTWNAASRAFNQARIGWLNLLGDLGMAHVVEEMCPGKVPALIAADVARWHDESGSTGHADAAMFAELPLPWDVVLDGTGCPAALVREVAAKHGIDADTTGWTKAYQQEQLEAASPAPDLVHGVSVASPDLAVLLRKNNLLAGGLAGRARVTVPVEPAEVGTQAAAGE